MAQFIEGSRLNVVIEDLIRNADNYLYLISPYIKLHSRVKDALKLKKNLPELSIVIMFGKNEDKPLSINDDDLEFFKEFPNIEIRYEKNLHAKYYASEDGGLITSMNLYDFSQNNNIEVGVYTETPGKLQGIFNDLVSKDDDLDSEAFFYFKEKVEIAELLFKKQAHFESTRYGLSKNYSHSTVEVDKINSFFPGKKKDAFAGFKTYESAPQKSAFIKKESEAWGYCIRTGEKIPFNPERPYCAAAFKSWNNFKNPNYKENYCHKSGQPSEGKTSFANPVLYPYWKK